MTINAKMKINFNFRCLRISSLLMVGLVAIPVGILISVASPKSSSAGATITYPQNSQKTKENQIAQAAEVVNCEVINIRTGQLALRFSPNGRSRAGLNNGNLVRFIDRQGIWFYVRVLEGPNSRVNGLEGWLNSNYIECYWD